MLKANQKRGEKNGTRRLDLRFATFVFASRGWETPGFSFKLKKTPNNNSVKGTIKNRIKNKLLRVQ